jgi:carbonic anhydrase
MTQDRMHFPSYLIDRYRQWYQTRFLTNQAWYTQLAESGQRPRTMIISCCDSRMDSVAMFGSEPGDLFVVRNVANLVPPYSPDSKLHGTSAAIEYAVLVLKVTHIVVVGHSSCGGVGAYYDICCGNTPKTPDNEEFMFVGPWMDILQPAYETLGHEDKSHAERVQLFEKHAIKTSLDNLRSFPFVERAINSRKLTIHGGWFDIKEGVLHELVADEFEPVRMENAEISTVG